MNKLNTSTYPFRDAFNSIARWSVFSSSACSTLKFDLKAVPLFTCASTLLIPLFRSDFINSTCFSCSSRKRTPRNNWLIRSLSLYNSTSIFCCSTSSVRVWIFFCCLINPPSYNSWLTSAINRYWSFEGDSIFTPGTGTFTLVTSDWYVACPLRFICGRNPVLKLSIEYSLVLLINSRCFING